jgi:hypothetical protein
MTDDKEEQEEDSLIKVLDSSYKANYRQGLQKKST